MTDKLLALATEVVTMAKKKKTTIVTAESCTGGLVAAYITEVPGASEVFDRGFVVYANDAKMAMLDVDRKTITDFGAVSAETAVEMAEGALRASLAEIAVSITGIAGPDGGTPQKPPGTVYIAIADNRPGRKGEVMQKKFSGTRAVIRREAVESAFRALKEALAGI